MARLGGITSEALPAPSAGLASILRDHKDLLRARNGRANVVLGLVEPQSVSVPSSPESSLDEADVGADEWDEVKEDLWPADSRSCLPDLSRTPQIQHGCHRPRVPRRDPSFNKLNLNAPAENVGVIFGFAKVADGVKAKKRENGAAGHHVFRFAKQRADGAEMVRSSARRREGKAAVSDASKITAGLYSHAQLQEALATSQEKTPSRCPSASRMIPQLGAGMGKYPSKQHSERQSAPVQVPDWSKIVAKTNAKARVMMDNDDEEGDKDDDDDRLPPHELLAREYARSQVTSFSVCEGQGRTLKGRDLSRVRDAVWSQMGFAD